MSIYTEKSLLFVRQRGYMAEVVEKFIKAPTAKFGFRRDLFKIVDIVAISEEMTLGIQSTGIDQRKPHLDKLYGEEIEKTLKWILGPRQLWLMSWRKEKRVRGGTAFRYIPKIERLGVDGPVEIPIEALPKIEVEVMEIP